MEAVINRLKDNDHKQTLGHFLLYDGIDVALDCKSLELPDKGNKRDISRIPAGQYICKFRWSSKFGWHFHVTDVKDRSWILIHIGNYYTQIQGCILLGSNYYDINGDGHLDVTSSGKTLKRLLRIAPREFRLTINDLDK